MLNYETLDAIADTYTPLLALLAFGMVVSGLWMAQWKLSAIKSLSLVGTAFIAYGFMTLDAYFNIGSFLSLDYSTHTAVSLGLIIFLYFNARRLAIVWIVSFILYLMLMLYQQYHTIADILVTGVVVGFPVWRLISYLAKRHIASYLPEVDD